jgi:hypothetical protein
MENTTRHCYSASFLSKIVSFVPMCKNTACIVNFKQAFREPQKEVKIILFRKLRKDSFWEVITANYFKIFYLHDRI